MEKEEFMAQFGEGYGYPNAPKNIDEIRATEFKRLQGVLSVEFFLLIQFFRFFF